MIEHHSMALLTSDQILQKTKNRKIKNLANQIMETQRNQRNERSFSKGSWNIMKYYEINMIVK